MSKKKNADQNASQQLELVEAEALARQAEMRKLRGKFRWQGDLDEMRTDSDQLQDWYDSQYGQ